MLERRRGDRRPGSVSAWKDIVGVTGRQTLNGKPIGEGKAEDPFATLAWLANLLAERGRDLTAGMVVITGSLIPTFSIAPATAWWFTIEGLARR